MTDRPRLNRWLGRWGALRKNSLRYRLVQALGWLLWGRPIGYLSWWEHAGVAAGVMLFHKGKLLLGRRRNVLEGTGKFSTIGGFVNLHDKEDFAQGLVREVWEETGLRLKSESFTLDNLVNFYIRHNGRLAEQPDSCHVGATYVYHLTDDEAAQIRESDEMHDFVYVDRAELEALIARGELAFPGAAVTMRRAFDRGLNVPPSNGTGA
jgi:8-oxo-dGTP pyrophosphatase MutT (NUDIX family)